MYCIPKQDWYENGITIPHRMKDIGIPEERICGAIKVLMYIDKFIQYVIDYSGKYKRTC